MAKEADSPSQREKPQEPLSYEPFEDDTAVAQVVFQGDWRKTPVGEVTVGGETQTVHHMRKTRVVVFLRQLLGTHGITAADQSAVVPSDLPHMPHDAYTQLYDLSDEDGTSMKTVRKQKTSASGVDTQQQFEDRGAIPGYRITKPAHSFRLASTHAEIYPEHDVEPEEKVDPLDDELADIPF